VPVPLPPAPPPKEEVIRRLREAMPMLQKLYVNRLALYGSVAWDEQRQGSDIDLLVGFDESLMEQQTGQRLSLCSCR
jgi:predicted nucleotidyltransferase